MSTVGLTILRECDEIVRLEFCRSKSVSQEGFPAEFGTGTGAYTAQSSPTTVNNLAFPFRNTYQL